MTQRVPDHSEGAAARTDLQIFQAVYGERDRGHGLLRTSAEEAPATEVIALTDRPENAPATLAWHPYVRGFVWNSWYVLARTFSDPNASRAGMVFTHALFVRLHDFVLMPRLDDVASILMTEVDKDKVLETLMFPIHHSDTQNRSETVPPNTTRLAGALLRANGAPVVWLGQDGFEESIYDLWARLWPTARGSLQFGVLFSPQDLEGQPLSLVATPRQLASRWTGYQVIDVASPAQSEPTTPSFDAALTFVLERSRQTPLSQFLDDLESIPSGLGDVMLAARVLPLLPRLAAQSNAPNDAEALRSIARVAGKLSPDPKRGGDLKRGLIDRLGELTAAGTDEDITALRNFDTAPFDGAVQVLGGAIKRWLELATTQPSSAGARSADIRRDVGRVILLAEGEGAWATNVRAAVAAAFGCWSIDLARRVWSWLRTDPTVVERLSGQLPPTAGDPLAEACPTSLSVAVATAVLEKIAIPRTWDTLGAAVLCSAYAPSEAYDNLGRLSTLATARGYATIAKCVPTIETIRQAVTTGNQVLCQIAGELCATEPDLLSGLDPTSPSWLTIWDAAAQTSHDVWRGIDNPSVALNGLISAVVGSVPVPQTLLQAVARSDHASLLDNPSRGQVWSAVTGETRNAFISATADDWLKRQLAGISSPSLDTGSEADLQAAVIEDSRVRRILRDIDGSALVAVVALFQSTIELPELLLQEWIHGRASLAQSASRDGALALAKLISDRAWGISALEVATLASQYPQSALRLTFQATAHLLPLWRRILMWDWLPQSVKDDDDAWAALVELAAKLYPWGPGERDVWERSGGDLSRMPIRDSGWESWQAATVLIRQGGGGWSLSGRRLVKAMQDDFPQNEQLRLLRQLPPFR